MTMRYAHLAPKHTLAAVERLDAHTETASDTTTDTGATVPTEAQAVALQ
jgi:hypothetical protein